MEKTQEDLTKELIKRKNIAIVLDIILFVLLVALMIYLFKNIEYIKIMASDVCRICQDKFNATCFKGGSYSSFFSK